MTAGLSILMITHKPNFGASFRSFAMGSRLVKMGHHVTLMVVSQKNRVRFNEYDWEGVRTIETPDLLWGRLRTGWDPWATCQRSRFLKTENIHYDLIHCFETRPGTIYPALSLANRDNTPIFTDWNDWFGRHGLIDVNRPFWYPFFFGWIETHYEEAYRAKSTGLTVISSYLGKRALDLGVDPQRIRLIPGGTVPELFPVRSVRECREMHSVNLDDPILGFSSADSHLDMEIIMAALKIVAKKFPRVKLIISGKVKKNVRNIANHIGVEQYIHFLGYLPYEELPNTLGCANIFLLPMADKPYNWGRWPNKMGDYMCMGRPTVANPIGDIKDLMEREEIGLLAGATPEDFAQKIIFLLENPDIAEKLGQNARQVAVEQFNWDILVHRLLDFYQRLIPQKGEM